MFTSSPPICTWIYLNSLHNSVIIFLQILKPASVCVSIPSTLVKAARCPSMSISGIKVICLCFVRINSLWARVYEYKIYQDCGSMVLKALSCGYFLLLNLRTISSSGARWKILSLIIRHDAIWLRFCSNGCDGLRPTSIINAPMERMASQGFL